MARKITSISAYRNKKEKEEIQLQTAMSVDMPEGLERRLLQIPERNNSGSKRSRPWLGVAAALLMALTGYGMYPMLEQSNLITSGSLIQDAMAHAGSQQAFIQGIDEAVSLQQVNMKLQPFGSKLDHLPGHVYYVNHCQFGKKTVFQMVLANAQGQKVSVYIVPQSSSDEDMLDRGNMSGVQVPVNHASLVVLGEDEQEARAMSDKMKAAIEWHSI